MSDNIKAAIVGRGITPEMPVEPPKEALEQKFEYNPELFKTDGGETIVKIDDKEVKLDTPQAEKKVVSEEKKVEEVKKEVVDDKKKEELPKSKSVLKPPTEEVKKEDVKAQVVEAQPTGEKKEIIKPISPVKEKKEADDFDYTKYSPQEVTNLKNMSRQSREAYVKLLDENKQLSSLKDATYLQHEQGYTLSPEFQELQTRQYYANTEAQLWKEQLLNIRAAKPFKPIVGIDEKSGKFLYGPERQATDEDEIQVNNNLMECNRVAGQIAGQLQTYPNQFKQRVSTDLAAIQQEQNARFSWVSDTKLLDYTVPIDGLGEKKIRDIKQDFKNLFPPYLANSVGVDVAANMMVALQIQAAELKEARNGKQIAEIEKKEISRAEPTSDNVEKPTNGSTIKGVPSVFSLEGMPGH